jgi:hypothetical protein
VSSTICVTCIVITGVGRMYLNNRFWCIVIFLLSFPRMYIILHSGRVQWLQYTVLQLLILMSLHHFDIHWHIDCVMKYNAEISTSF